MVISLPDTCVALESVTYYNCPYDNSGQDPCYLHFSNNRIEAQIGHMALSRSGDEEQSDKCRARTQD